MPINSSKGVLAPDGYPEGELVSDRLPQTAPVTTEGKMKDTDNACHFDTFVLKAPKRPLVPAKTPVEHKCLPGTCQKSLCLPGCHEGELVFDRSPQAAPVTTRPH